MFSLFDPTNTGVITSDNWMRIISEGTRLPDFGFGPGHHGDIEYEYEIHHFEKYHGDDSTVDELNHPEDIEHFAQHEQIEREEAEREAKFQGISVEEALAQHEHVELESSEDNNTPPANAEGAVPRILWT